MSLSIRKWHYLSGVTLSVFIFFHIANHLVAFTDFDNYLAVMEAFRKVYRHPVVESLLLAAALSQVVSGIKLLFVKKQRSLPEKIQFYSGIYLAYFLTVHIGAVMYCRYVYQLDSNIYLGAVGLNYFPAILYFFPYYFVAVAGISLHVAAIHYRKTGNRTVALMIGLTGTTVSVLILLGLTDFFRFRTIPEAYQRVIGPFLGRGF